MAIGLAALVLVGLCSSRADAAPITIGQFVYEGIDADFGVRYFSVFNNSRLIDLLKPGGTFSGVVVHVGAASSNLEAASSNLGTIPPGEPRSTLADTDFDLSQLSRIDATLEIGGFSLPGLIEVEPFLDFDLATAGETRRIYFTPAPVPVPEPTTVSLLAAGLFTAAMRRRTARPRPPR